VLNVGFLKKILGYLAVTLEKTPIKALLPAENAVNLRNEVTFLA
jgi:hypothetical protein